MRKYLICGCVFAYIIKLWASTLWSRHDMVTLSQCHNESPVGINAMLRGHKYSLWQDYLICISCTLLFLTKLHRLMLMESSQAITCVANGLLLSHCKLMYNATSRKVTDNVVMRKCRLYLSIYRSSWFFSAASFMNSEHWTCKYLKMCPFIFLSWQTAVSFPSSIWNFGAAF